MSAIFWHRRDLRIEDNAGLYKALSQQTDVLPIFIFDSNILESLSKVDQRVRFIHECLKTLKKEYQALGRDLLVVHGDPKVLIPELAVQYAVSGVYTNRDYEPYAAKRDQFIFEKLKELNIPFIGTKDHVIFEKNEVLKADGTPYTVFTPYSRKWKATLQNEHLESFDVSSLKENLRKNVRTELPTLGQLGFEDTQIHPFPKTLVEDDVLKKYKERRDIPAVGGTSKLSIHLRFGTISIRKLAKQAMRTSETYLNELIWREFYQMILYHFPHSIERSFKPAYDRIVWERNEEHYKAWCEGRTGYPLVDAGMRELNETGFMHNRVRMVTASFLTKHLLLDWRLGEAYFAEKLLDFELASNVGGWQWAAGTGCDAAPYFRVFNPQSQQEKFDPKFEYIKKWVPEFGTANYPQPIVEHTFARNRAITRYKEGLNT
ncbi:MAG: DNA photolyase family protein [Cryomorphaceae bacterium]|jgi:deoxyribodipyrimidine photo-lyase|nr:DNA photolyase family protein [Cryomorphaceae bacterium]